MRWLVRSAKTNDSLFFHCEFVVICYHICVKVKPDSGHGGQTKDLNGDEIDGWDEGTLFSFELNSIRR